MNIDTEDLISVTDASNRGVSRLVTDAENGRPQVLVRNNKVVAAVVGLDELARLRNLDELESDLRLLAVALVRTVADNGHRYTFDEVLARSGITRAELDES
jgi:antitoxin (DNA-binding transcriptional repressor) of toxin-antitoxin stability system